MVFIEHLEVYIHSSSQIYDPILLQYIISYPSSSVNGGTNFAHKSMMLVEDVHSLTVGT